MINILILENHLDTIRLYSFRHRIELIECVKPKLEFFAIFPKLLP